jgi:hypothetical protein
MIEVIKGIYCIEYKRTRSKRTDVSYKQSRYGLFELRSTETQDGAGDDQHLNLPGSFK